MATPDPGDLDQNVRVTTILAAAMATTVPVYVVVAWLVTPAVTTPLLPGGTLRTLTWVLGAVAAAELLFAPVMFRAQVAAAGRSNTAGERLSGYRNAVVIAFALRESVAIFGLVLSFIGGDPTWSAVFAAAALAAMLIGWPRRSDMEALARSVPPVEP